MRLLTLIRHGKSGWEHEGLQDFERPLSERGWRDVPRVSRHFAAQLNSTRPRPERVISSFATRALTTARLFAHELELPMSRLRISERLYDNTAADCFMVTRRIDERVVHACLVGHNPSMSDFAAELLHEQQHKQQHVQPIGDLPTSAIVCLELQCAHWRELKPGCAKLISFDSPKKLKG